MSVLVIVFSDGSGDKKAATGAGADFNPEFVSVCSVLLCLSLSLPPLLPPSAWWFWQREAHGCWTWSSSVA